METEPRLPRFEDLCARIGFAPFLEIAPSPVAWIMQGSTSRSWRLSAEDGGQPSGPNQAYCNPNRRPRKRPFSPERNLPSRATNGAPSRRYSHCKGASVEATPIVPRTIW
jgi:hypothetical protein